MALFSELAEAMNLLYGIDTNENSRDCNNGDYVISDYNMFSEGLNDPLLPGYDELEQHLLSEPSGNEDDIDFF